MMCKWPRNTAPEMRMSHWPSRRNLQSLPFFLSGCRSNSNFTVRPSFFEPDRPERMDLFFLLETLHYTKTKLNVTSGLLFRKSAVGASALFLPPLRLLFRFIFKSAFPLINSFCPNRRETRCFYANCLQSARLSNRASKRDTLFIQLHLPIVTNTTKSALSISPQ